MFLLKQFLKPFLLPPMPWLMMLVVAGIFWRRRWARGLFWVTVVLIFALHSPGVGMWVRYPLESRYTHLMDPTSAEPYDAIVSVGAFEHFAKSGATKAEKLAAYRKFFEWCHAHSTDDCSLSLQTIVYENYDESNPNPFVEEIFPESELPRVSEIFAACEGLFEVVQLQNHRAHYAKTLQAWFNALRKNRHAAIDIVGEATYKKYEKYLGVFIVGFHTGTVNLSRMEARKLSQPKVA